MEDQYVYDTLCLHFQHNVFDLVRSNTAAASTSYHCTSDHPKMSGTVHLLSKTDLSEVEKQLRVNDADLEEFSRYLKLRIRPGRLRSVAVVIYNMDGRV